MKKLFCLVLAAALFLLLAVGVCAEGEAVDTAPEASVLDAADAASDGDDEDIPVWQAVVEDILAYVVLGITAIVGIYTAFSPLLILLKKAVNKFVSATNGVLSTAKTGDAQNTELKNLKAEFKQYIADSKEQLAKVEREATARAEKAEKMLQSLMQMFATMCCASPDLVKSGVARKVADLKNQFSTAVPVLKDAREEVAGDGKET